jgi:hypothetical protein
MVERVRDLQQEIDDLRHFADQGRSVPLVSGVYFLSWGVVIGLGALAAREAILSGHGMAAGWIWVSAVIVGWLVAATLARLLKLKSREGGVAFSNQVTKASWIAAGLTVSGYLVMAHVSGSPPAGVSTVALLVSGMAVVAAAAASETRLMYGSGAGLIATGLATVGGGWGPAATAGAVAVAMFAFLALPGLVLTLQHRRAR